MKPQKNDYLLSILYLSNGNRQFTIWLNQNKTPMEQLTIGGEEKGLLYLVVYKPPRAIVYDIENSKYVNERVFSRSNARLLKDIFSGQMLSDLETYFWQRKMPEV